MKRRERRQQQEQGMWRSIVVALLVGALGGVTFALVWFPHPLATLWPSWPFRGSAEATAAERPRKAEPRPALPLSNEARVTAPVSPANSSDTHANVTRAAAIGESHPLSHPSTSPAVSAEGLHALDNAIANLIQQQSGTYGYFLIDLNTGAYIGENEDLPFPAASTFKLPMSMYILSQVDQGKVRLDEPLTQTVDDWEDGTGILQEGPSGSQYTVADLIDLAIEQSDNIATNMLMRRFGHEAVWKYEQELGGQFTHDDDRVNIVSARDLARYMKDAQDPKLLSAASRQRLMNALTHTAFPIRIAAGVPDSVVVAHKIGSLDNVFNDVAVVQYPGQPYVLAICSQNEGEDEGERALAEISRLVYTYYSQGHL